MLVSTNDILGLQVSMGACSGQHGICATFLTEVYTLSCQTWKYYYNYVYALDEWVHMDVVSQTLGWALVHTHVQYLTYWLNVNQLQAYSTIHMYVKGSPPTLVWYLQLYVLNVKVKLHVLTSACTYTLVLVHRHLFSSTQITHDVCLKKWHTQVRVNVYCTTASQDNRRLIQKIISQSKKFYRMSCTCE